MLDGYLRRSEAIKLETKSRWGGVGGKGGAKCVGRTVVKERSDGVQIKYKVLGGEGMHWKDICTIFGQNLMC